MEDIEVTEDDVLLPVAGILDVLDNYAFVRTSGYLPGPNDVYVSLSMVRRNGLRKGDAVTGSVRQPREGEARQKFNPLVKIETINGSDAETSRNRIEFGKLTPLYPQERLRLANDNEPHNPDGSCYRLGCAHRKGSADSSFRHRRRERRWSCSALPTQSLRTTLNAT